MQTQLFQYTVIKFRINPEFNTKEFYLSNQSLTQVSIERNMYKLTFGHH